MTMLQRLALSLALFAITTPLAAAPYGAQSMVAPLKKVLVKAPDASFSDADPVTWHYISQPDLTKAQKEHQDFASILKNEGVEVLYHTSNLPGLPDAIFVHDPVTVTKKGAIILRMGKELRRGEEAAVEKRLNELGVPTYYKLSGQATAEAGDMLWLDEKTLLVGRGFRTNDEGIRQLREAVEPLGVELIAIDLPYDQGAEACLHLQSLISIIDDKTAVVYKPLMVVSFVKLLGKRGWTLIDVPESEYLTMGPNILAIRPGVVLTIEGNPVTKQRMEAAGVRVLTYRGQEISLKAEGGATCLTRPILRS